MLKENEVIIYKWNGYGWDIWERRVVLVSDRSKLVSQSDPCAATRWKPCWWHNYVEQVQSITQPEGYVKGKLPESYASARRRFPCVRCGRAFYVKKEFVAHECINAK